MSSNNPPVTPGRVRALTNEWEDRSKNTTPDDILDALPDRNCGLAPQPAPKLNLVSPNLQPNAVQARADSRTFTLFPNLPPELRLKIWKLLVPTHRRHFLTDNAMTHNRSHPRTNPPILYVNFESRSVALKHLKILFSCANPVVPGQYNYGVNMIGDEQFKYFNPKTDTIVFDNQRFSRLSRFKFYVGPYSLNINYSEQEPMAECDDIISIEVRESRINQFGPSPNFRNLERLTIQYNRNRTTRFAQDPVGRRAFVRSLHQDIKGDLRFARLWFEARYNRGLVSRVPVVGVVVTRADLRALDLIGDFAVRVFADLAR